MPDRSVRSWPIGQEVIEITLRYPSLRYTEAR